MNAFKISQEQQRQLRRAQQLLNFKANSRNALLYFNSNNICSLCSQESWAQNVNSHHTITLVFNVFENGQTCPQHSNILIEKTKQSLLEVPNQYRRLMGTEEDKKDTRQHVIRKIVLLLELLDETLLNSCQELREQIIDSFNEKDTFIIHLMDCAYGYCHWPMEEEGLGDEQWHYEIRALSLQTILSIFNKFPLMICAFLQQYPFQTLLSKTNTSNKLHLYEYIILLFQHCSISAINYQPILLQIQCSLAKHLQEIRGLLIPNEVMESLACWISTMLKAVMPFQCQTVSIILQFLQNNSLSLNSRAVIIALLRRDSELRSKVINLESHASPMELEQ